MHWGSPRAPRSRRRGRTSARRLSGLRFHLRPPSRCPARFPRSDLQLAHRRQERHAQVQQPGSLDVHGHADRGEHARRIPRRLVSEYGSRVPRAPAHARRRSRHIRGKQWSDLFPHGHRGSQLQRARYRIVTHSLDVPDKAHRWRAGATARLSHVSSKARRRRRRPVGDRRACEAGARPGARGGGGRQGRWRRQSEIPPSGADEAPGLPAGRKNRRR